MSSPALFLQTLVMAILTAMAVALLGLLCRPAELMGVGPGCSWVCLCSSETQRRPWIWSGGGGGPGAVSAGRTELHTVCFGGPLPPSSPATVAVPRVGHTAPWEEFRSQRARPGALLRVAFTSLEPINRQQESPRAAA